MWVLIDNHDSFTHILQHTLLQACDTECRVVPGDAVSLEELIALKPERIILAPGPETPQKAGITLEALAYFHNRIPVLGVCLGHQAIGLHFGARLVRAPEPKHGHRSLIRFEESPLFEGLPSPFEVMRYHSLVLEGLKGTELRPIAWAVDDGTVQAVAHKSLPVMGVQFHPESVGSPVGLQLLRNWAAM